MTALAPDPGVAADIAAGRFGIAATATRLPGEVDHNFLLDGRRDRYVLRLSPATVPALRIEAVVAVLRHVAASGLGIATPVPMPGTDGAYVQPWDGGAAHLLTWVGGTPLASAATRGDDVLLDIGRTVGDVVACLSSFERIEDVPGHPWDMGDVAKTIADHAPAVADSVRRELVLAARERFLDRVAPIWNSLPAQQIHNDLNDLNLLVTGTAVTGLIDFGDSRWSPRVVDPAVALTYVMLGREDPVTDASVVARGFAERIALSRPETSVLLDLVLARLALSVTIAADRERGDNPHHQVSTEAAWELLERLHAGDDAAISGRLEEAAGVAGAAPDGTGELLERRRKVIAPSLSLHYEAPLHIVRGKGPYLYDAEAREYVDAVNNVAHVGHGHPRVVEAAHRQMRMLNTNTRYLHRSLVEYAERLTAKLPEPLSVCVLVNSGSEAIELALRMARTATGATDVLVFRDGYHGNTSAAVAMSPYKFLGPGGGGRPEWVHVLPTPDPYRSEFCGTAAAAAYRHTVEETIAAAGRNGRRIAALVAEPIIGCGGQVVPEPGVLAKAFAAVRDAGALCIADEVQVGFGRVGEAFWGFELHDVVPDIVTLGKPIGNGHPLGAVVTTTEIAGAFADGMEYFNTFGGNPVSAVVGLAVLDAIESESLQERALEVGAYIAEGLLALADRHRGIGDVRGAGLFLGLELVRDRKTREADPGLASAVIERARQLGVLLSIDGPHRNVVKIKPPLVVGLADADRILAAVDGALTRPGPDQL